MKEANKICKRVLVLTSLALSFSVKAQQEMQFFRPNNELGVNMFETSKSDTIPFSKMGVHVGGNFELDFQGLRDWNTATPMTKPGYTGNVNSLIGLTNGFDLPMANLNVDAQLEDGIRMNLSVYLTSRYREDTWLKGGYIQFDKLLFLKSDGINRIMKSVTIKIGELDVNYGDQHFRRSDGGSAIYNPFVENYVMDEFTTELGTEVYYHNICGLFILGGMTNGELYPTSIAATTTDSLTGRTNQYDMAFHGKIGYDKQISHDFRLRISGSFYEDQSANSNTLFSGDRTGSRYFSIMSNQAIANGTVLSNENDYNAFSGRYDPGFSEQVNAFMGNILLKYKGLKFFGTAEAAGGRTITEKRDREANQLAGDLIYRFAMNGENFWIGVRYNTVTAAMQGAPVDITINREVASFGCFLTKNIATKIEYVNQVYQNYVPTNILNGGRFSGYMLEASVGF